MDFNGFGSMPLCTKKAAGCYLTYFHKSVINFRLSCVHDVWLMSFRLCSAFLYSEFLTVWSTFCRDIAGYVRGFLFLNVTL